jgi:hypothetical protein
MRRSISLKLLQSASYDVEHARTAASSMRALNSGKPRQPFGPRPQARRAPSPRCRAGADAALVDLSCGPRRDLKVFAELSRTALPSEGAARFAIIEHVGSGREGCSRIPQARSVLQGNICSQLDTRQTQLPEQAHSCRPSQYVERRDRSDGVPSEASACLNTQLVPVSREAPQRDAREVSVLPTRGAHFDRHLRTGRAPFAGASALSVTRGTAPLVRGLHFRGECVGQSTATRVIATQFHASLCHPSDDKIAPFISRHFPGPQPETYQTRSLPGSYG